MQGTLQRSIKFTAYLILIFSGLKAGSQNKKYLSYKINLKKEDITINIVFKEITKQTGLRIFSLESILPLEDKVSVAWVDIALEKALAQILTPRNLTFKIQDGAILVKSMKQPATAISEARDTDSSYAISGRITDSLGVPLPGAFVLLKGTKRGAVSGDDGGFILKQMTGNAKIVITYTGFKSQEFDVDGARFFSVKMNADPRSIQQVEVVSTGYQTLPKERATGSFDFINKKLFNEQTSPDILSRLEAVSSGLQVNRNIDSKGVIIIRGISSLAGPRTPLIILDNFPYDGDINNINPNDVESITILKDAAASSIWGARAGNGVIVITTKHSNYNQPISVSFNVNLSVAGKPDPYALKEISSPDLISVQKFLFDNKYYNNRESDIYSRTPVPQAVEYMIAQRDGKITAQQLTDDLDALGKHDVRNDFLKYMYQDAVHQQYAVTVNGGSNLFSWILSSGYDKDISNLSANSNKMNFRTLNTFRPAKNIELTAGIYYTGSTGTSGKPEYNSINTNYGRIPIYTSLASASGAPLPVIKDYRQTFLDTVGDGHLLDWNYYPLTDYKYNQVTTKSQDVLVNAGISYKPFDFLSLDLKYQYEQSNNDQNTLYDQQSYYARNFINSYTSIDDATGLVAYGIPLGSIQYLSNSILRSNDYRVQASINKTWKDHSISAILGNEIRDSRTTGYTTGNYGLDPNNFSIANVNYAQLYPQFIGGYSAYVPNPNGLSGTLDRYVSYFGNAAYTYKNKYTVSASGRRDASNLFGVSTNDKWKPLWSAGAGWDISKESFYHLAALPYLKMRATYGFSGNVDQSLSAVSTILYYDVSPYTLTPYSLIASFKNPSLKWEKVGVFNVALDFELLHNILGGSIDYFHKVASDLYGRVPVDYTEGLVNAFVEKNVAKMSGNGVDISIRSAILRGKFKWNMDLQASYYKDKILTYYLFGAPVNQFVNAGGGTVSGIKGRPVYSTFSYKSAGLDATNGDPQGYVDGKISKDYSTIMNNTDLSSLHYNGPASPTYYGSMGSNMSWKGFDMAVRLTYKFGYKFHAMATDYSNLFRSSKGFTDFDKRWQHPGDEKHTTLPSMVYPADPYRDQFYDGSEVLINSGSVVRLQYVTISYNILQGNPARFFLKSFQVYSNFNNLGIIWKANKVGVDPEYINQIPPRLNVAFGIRTNF